MTGLMALSLVVLGAGPEPGWPRHLNYHCSGPFIFSASAFRNGWLSYTTIEDSLADSIYVLSPDARDIGPWPEQSPMLSAGAVALADLNQDGVSELIYTTGNAVNAVDMSTGQEIPGWPVALESGGGQSVYLQSGAHLWDMDNDGVPEVVVMQRLYGPGPDSSLYYMTVKIYAIKADGSYMSGWPWVSPSVPLGFIFGKTSYLAVGDPDGDGQGEVFCAVGQYVYLLNANGQPESGWPVDFGSFVPQAWLPSVEYTAIANMDNDTEQELIAYAETNDTTDTNTVISDTSLLIVCKTDGSLLSNSPWVLRHTGEPLLGDFDGDSLADIMMHSSDKGVVIRDAYNNEKYAFPMKYHMPDTKLRISADIDGDGCAELLCAGAQVFGDMDTKEVYSKERYYIAWLAYDRFGSILWSEMVKEPCPPESLAWPASFMACGRPSVSDVDEDGKLELFGTVNAIMGEDYCGGHWDERWMFSWEIPDQSWRVDWNGLDHDVWNTNNYDFVAPAAVFTRESSGSENPRVALSPNPSTGSLNLLCQSPVDMKRISLCFYDASGRLRYIKKPDISGTLAQLNVPPGVYIVKILQEQTVMGTQVLSVLR